MLTIPLSLANIHDDNKKTYVQDLRACGAQRVLLTIQEFFEEGEERVKVLENLRRNIAYFEQEGFDVGVWCNTLGYGTRRPETFHKKFGHCTRITNFEGRTGIDTVCLLNEDFAEEIQRWMIEFAQAGAKLILIDDDLVLSVRPGFTCACEKHLALFSAHAGRSFEREALPGLFTGKPNALRTLYMDLQGQAMTGFCMKLRVAVDQVSPEIRLGLCASYTHFDLEGVELEKMVRLMAGKTKPLLRLSGATYWSCFAPRLNERQTLSAVLEFVRAQAGWLRGSDIELMDENDPYPRKHWLVPSSYTELYDCVMLANGGTGRLNYILHYGPDKQRGDTSYLEACLENRPDKENLIRMFAGKAPVGWRVYQAEHLIREAELPEPYMGDYALMSRFTQPHAGILLTENSMPTVYEGGGTGIVFGEHARHLTEEQLNAGLLLDAPAAKILSALGVDVGLRRMERTDPPSCEIFCSDTGRSIPFTEPRGIFYRMTLDCRAETVSTFQNREQSFPACYTYENSSGQRFAVYSFAGETLRYYTLGTGGMGAAAGDERQLQLAALYAYLSGRQLPAVCMRHPNLYLLAAKDNGSMSLLLCNMYPEKAFCPRILLDEAYRIASVVKGTAELDKNELVLSTIAPFDWMTVDLKKINP